MKSKVLLLFHVFSSMQAHCTTIYTKRKAFCFGILHKYTLFAQEIIPFFVAIARFFPHFWRKIKFFMDALWTLCLSKAYFLFSMEIAQRKFFLFRLFSSSIFLFFLQVIFAKPSIPLSKWFVKKDGRDVVRLSRLGCPCGRGAASYQSYSGSRPVVVVLEVSVVSVLLSVVWKSLAVAR